MALIDVLYAAAAHVGFLQQCTWHPADGPPITDLVGLRAPEATVLGELTLSTETVITFPARLFAGIAAGDAVELDGVRYQVRDVRAVGDGSERQATLSRL